tara:strand:- start:11959 stop:12795 length:837 start_codon:yes stop_codon:yes gene_type:complete
MRNNQRRSGRRPGATQPSSPPPTAELAFAVPTEFVELPSRGKFYPPDHPLHNQKTVEIKFMTAKEEDILSSEALLKSGQAVDRLLENILVLDIDPGTLLVGDRSALLIAARVSGYGAEYIVKHLCKSCVSREEINFDLNNATIIDDCFNDHSLEEKGVVYNPDTQTFDVTLPTTGVCVGMSLIDGYAERDTLLDDSDQRKESLVTSTLLAFLTKVNDNMDPNYVYEFVEVMPAKDSKFLRDLYPKLVPNIRLLHEFACKSCYSKEDMEVPLTAAFFWP